jgi:hypothetical protein
MEESMNIQGVYSVTSGEFASRNASRINLAERPERINDSSKINNIQKNESFKPFIKREEKLSSAYKAIGMGNYVNFSA